MSYMSPYYMTHIIWAIFYGPYTRFFECINTSHLVQLFDFLHSMDYIDQKPTQLLNGLRISYDSVTFKRIFKESLVLWVFYFTLEFILGILIHMYKYWQWAEVTFEDGYHSIMNHIMTHITNTTYHMLHMVMISGVLNQGCSILGQYFLR